MNLRTRGLRKRVAACSGWLVFGIATFAATPVFALTPQQIFAKDAPSIVVVVAYDTSGQPAEQGSGVVIAQGQIVTNCHVVKGGVALQVKQGNTAYPATLHFADADRDLCQLSVPQLTAPPIEMGDAKTLQPGANVVAIGTPEGLELTISSGLVSSLRDFGDGTKIIQTTAAISPGSSGGGLFDDQGRLVGITAAYLKEGENLNFALPANWIAQLPHYPATFQTAATSAIDWVATAVALTQKSDWAALLEHARHWVRAQPQNAMAWFSLGAAYDGLHQDSEAVNAYQQELKLDPTDEMAWFSLGMGYGNLQQDAAAKSAFEQAIRLDPTDKLAWSNLGVIYDSLHQYVAAESVYGQAIKLDPTNEKAWFGLGVDYDNLHQYAAAVSAYKQAIKLDPTHEQSWVNLGSVYLDSQQYLNAAVDAFRHALGLDPTDAVAWYDLGIAYAYQGNRDGELETLQHLRKLDPTLADKLFKAANQ